MKDAKWVRFKEGNSRYGFTGGSTYEIVWGDEDSFEVVNDYNEGSYVADGCLASFEFIEGEELDALRKGKQDFLDKMSEIEKLVNEANSMEGGNKAVLIYSQEDLAEWYSSTC